MRQASDLKAEYGVWLFVQTMNGIVNFVTEHGAKTAMRLLYTDSKYLPSAVHRSYPLYGVAYAVKEQADGV